MASVPFTELPRTVTALAAAQAADYALKANARWFIRGWNNRLAARTGAALALIPSSGAKEFPT